jgi:hypothetical protein
LIYKEYGVRGNTGENGFAVTREYIAALESWNNCAIYEQMRRGDSQIKTIEKIVSLPIRKNKYFIDPASADPLDKEIADFVSQNLFSGMKVTWDYFISHACLMFPFGFSVFEKVFCYDPDSGKTILKSLEPRLPYTIYRWEPETCKDGSIRIKGVTQQDYYGKQHFIPTEKILLFTNDREGDNWEGVSIFRSVFKDWKIKNQIEKVGALAIDRGGLGVPILNAPEGIKKGSDEWTAAERLVSGYYASERTGAVLPFGYKFEIVSAMGKGVDPMPLIKHHSEEISKSVLAMFINLGTSNTGSRSLGDSFIDFFMDAEQSYADYIAQEMSRNVIKELVDYNWVVKKYPVLRAEKMKDVDAMVINEFKKSGLITADIEVENYLRKMVGMPEKKESVVQNDIAPDAKGLSDYKHKKLAENKNLEFIDLDGIEKQLDNTQESVLKKVLAIREEQAQAIAKQIGDGKPFKNLSIPRGGDIYKLLVSTYDSQVEVGKSQVKKEVEKQTGKAMSLRVTQDLDASELAYEEISMLVASANSKLASMLASLGIDARRSGKTGSELVKEILRGETEISAATWSDLVSVAVNRGWGDGRASGANELGDVISHGYYSSVLDSNVCSQCEETQAENDAEPDGVFEIGDPRFDAPNPKCEGGAKCRCLIVYVT